MKPIAALAVMLALAGSPAFAQNAGQISKARGGASCPGCNLFQADLGGAELGARNFAKARLRQADLSLSVMNRTSFAGGDLRDVNAYGAVFGSGVNFSGAEMDKAVGLSQAQLNRACGDSSTTLPRGLRLSECR
jgi:uncharacterized protein YjbI with pentapeptide repeats